MSMKVVEIVERLDKFTVGLKYPVMPKGEKGAKLTDDEKLKIFDQQKQYIALMKHIEQVVRAGKYFVKQTAEKGFRIFCVLSEFSEEPIFYVQLGCIKGTWVINFQWNPSKLTPVERDEFLGNITTMLYGHYDELFMRGVVSHAEFAVDVYGEDISNLVLVEKGRKTYFKKGTTVYFGCRGGSCVLTMYDKAKQLGENGMYIRIEARIKRRDITLKQLVEDSLVGNPFGNAIIVDVNQLQLVAAEFGKPQLAAHIMELGLYGAVKNKQLRLKIFSRLQEVAVDWWQPEQFWDKHQALLDELHPNACDSLSGGFDMKQLGGSLEQFGGGIKSESQWKGVHSVQTLHIAKGLSAPGM